MIRPTTARKLANRACLIAIQSHGGDQNKHDGEIYLAHVARVAHTARTEAAFTDIHSGIAEATAWLHDVVEDTPVTINEIKDQLLEVVDPDEYDVVDWIVTAVTLLTKTHGEPNEVYYKRIKTNKLATLVKKADMLDNFRRNHMIVDESDRARMGKKYSLGMDILG